MRMLSANHQIEHGIPIGGVREKTEVAEKVCNPIRTEYQPTRPPELPGTKPPSQESTGMDLWLHQASMGRESLLPVKAQYLSVGKCQGREVGANAWVGEGALS